MIFFIYNEGMNILLTGGAGYIGSHTLVELLNAGHQGVVVDNLVNSSRESIKRVEEITSKKVPFYELDLRDKEALDKVFKENDIDAVIHFAGLKAVGESVEKPLEYYDNNLSSTLRLFEVMKENNVSKLVFSSSATVYGSQESPMKEDMSVGVGITNPYGQTKFMIEQIMKDFAKSWDKAEFMALRYFNPVGAHPSGKIGEDPSGIPNNLMPFIAQVATGKRECLSIFGDDYDTSDGTGVRDYIHVVDLALGHLKAVENLEAGFDVINLGSGKGTSVLEMVKAFEKASDRKINYKIAPRRAGDLAEIYADVTKAKEKLNWSVTKTVDDMCRDTWNWQSKNPNGYENN